MCPFFPSNIIHHSHRPCIIYHSQIDPTYISCCLVKSPVASIEPGSFPTDVVSVIGSILDVQDVSAHGRSHIHIYIYIYKTNYKYVKRIYHVFTHSTPPKPPPIEFWDPPNRTVHGLHQFLLFAYGYTLYSLGSTHVASRSYNQKDRSERQCLR